MRESPPNPIIFHLYTGCFSSSFRVLFGFQLSSGWLNGICRTLVLITVVVEMRLLLLNHHHLLSFKYIPFLLAPDVSIYLLGVPWDTHACWSQQHLWLVRFLYAWLLHQDGDKIQREQLFFRHILAPAGWARETHIPLLSRALRVSNWTIWRGFSSVHWECWGSWKNPHAQWLLLTQPKPK